MICPHCKKEVLDFPVCTECGKPTEDVRHVVTASTEGYVNKNFTVKNMLLAVVLMVSLNAAWMIIGRSGSQKFGDSIGRAECDRKVLELINAMEDEKQHFAGAVCGKGLPITVNLKGKESFSALHAGERTKIKALVLKRWRSLVGDSGKVEFN